MENTMSKILIICSLLVGFSCTMKSKIKFKTADSHYVTKPLRATGPVKFYSRKNPYGEFSNFALFPITIEGKRWPTSEHYYQAKKFKELELQEKVRLTEPPEKAAKIGRDLL